MRVPGPKRKAAAATRMMRIPPALVEKIDALAAEETRTQTNMVERLIIEALAARAAKVSQ